MITILLLVRASSTSMQRGVLNTSYYLIIEPDAAAYIWKNVIKSKRNCRAMYKGHPRILEICKRILKFYGEIDLNKVDPERVKDSVDQII